MKVAVQYYDDLSEGEKQEQPDNGCGAEYSTYLVVEYDDKTRKVYSDAIEPEDCTFGRGLSWIGEELREAYKRGRDENLCKETN